MDTKQPSFEVGEYEMNDWHELFGNLRIATFHDGHVVIAALGEPSVAAPVISYDSGAQCHDAFNKTAKRIGAPVRHHGKSDASGVTAIPSRIGLGAWLALSNLDRSSHEGLMVDASPFSARTAAHPGFIGLDMLDWLSADPILIRAHHADTQFVKDLEGGFIARKPELPLELNG
jgi:hypothetical protein